MRFCFTAFVSTYLGKQSVQKRTEFTVSDCFMVTYIQPEVVGSSPAVLHSQFSVARRRSIHSSSPHERRKLIHIHRRQPGDNSRGTVLSLRLHSPLTFSHCNCVCDATEVRETGAVRGKYFVRIWSVCCVKHGMFLLIEKKKYLSTRRWTWTQQLCSCFCEMTLLRFDTFGRRYGEFELLTFRTLFVLFFICFYICGS